MEPYFNASEFDKMSSDAFLKDRNKRSKPSSSYVAFLAASLLGPPLLAVLGSTVVLSQALKRLTSSPDSKKAVSDADLSAFFSDAVASNPPNPVASRKYDMVLLGVTGFTGQLALEYYARNYASSGLRFAVAGRSASKVNASISAVRALVPTWSGPLDVLTCDSSDLPSVQAMCSSTSVVISTAGPFAKVGTTVVAGCAHNGTSYADITGESSWVRGNVVSFGPVCLKTGARVVSMCGNDSIPWEMSVLGLDAAMATRGDEIRDVTFFDELAGAASGGTLATMVYAVEEGGGNLRVPFPQGDPMLLATDNKALAQFPTKNVCPQVFPSKFFGRWMSPFLLSGPNCDAVSRSVALRSGGKGKINYAE